MTRSGDDRVRSALREAAAPGEGQAEERGWHVVREAFVEREPQPRRLGSRPRAALALVGAGLIAAFALSPAGADVRDWIADAIEVGEEDARPVIGSLPAPGSVLVESRDGVWVLHEDGSRRRVGDYEHATWSPNGLYVGASEGRELFALTPQGEVRWALTAPDPIRSLDWSSDEGFRVAYVAGNDLWVVAGDGTGKAIAAERIGSEAIAWRPETSTVEARHELAYVDGDNRVVLENTDSGRTLWRTERVPGPVASLQWSEAGDRLLVEGDGFATLLDANGEGPYKGPIATGTEATLAPDGDHAAVVRPSTRSGAELVLVPTELGYEAVRPLYPTTRGVRSAGFGPPTFSPDGGWILLPWPEADQWIFVRVADSRVVPLGDISRQLDPNARGEASFPRVAGWCCA